MTVVINPKVRPNHHAVRDYALSPMIVYWEMTQACELACRHCRADAILQPNPLELQHEESRKLLRQIAAFGEPLPHLILTGGDPLRRPDLFDLMDEAASLGLSVSITPAATPRLTADVIAQLKAHGAQSLGLSLDGSNAARHEAVRGIPGCYEWTLQAMRSAAEQDLPVQVNTLVAVETDDDLPAVYELLKTQKVMRWSLFFLIPVGRGKLMRAVSPERGEEIMSWVYDLAPSAPFAIKTTEAPSYRRIALKRMRASGVPAEELHRSSVYHGFGVRDGNGIMFVSSTGEIYPAGFLPLKLGDTQTGELVDVYRNAPIFRSLHNPNDFRGRCGRCEYRMICGGSRARAFAATGDPLESDPFCPYEPSLSKGEPAPV